MPNSLIINGNTVINANLDHVGRSATFSTSLSVGATTVNTSAISVQTASITTLVVGSISTSGAGGTSSGFAITGNGSFTGALTAGSFATGGTFSAGNSTFNGTITLGSVSMGNGYLNMGNTAINTSGITVDYFTSRNSVQAATISVVGASGSVNIQDRSNSAATWINYVTGGVYRLYINGGDRFSVDSNGNGSFIGNMSAAAITASGVIYGQASVKIGNGVDVGLYADGGNVALRTYANNTVFLQNQGGTFSMATFNPSSSQINTPLTVAGTLTTNSSLVINNGASIITNTSTIGGIRVISGGANNTGYIEFWAPTNTARLGYIGFGTNGATISLGGDAANFNFTGAYANPQVNGNQIWHAGNFNPGNYATNAALSGYATQASLNNTNANFGNYAALSGASFNGTVTINNAPLVISRAYPYIDLIYGGVYRWRTLVDNAANLLFQNGDNGQTHFYVTAGGSIWCRQFGDVYSQIENRAAAFADDRKNGCVTSARMYYAGDIGNDWNIANGFQSFAGGTACVVDRATGFGNSSDQLIQVLRFRQFQVYIPYQGWVNFYATS